jgi:DNA-binding response OmpR family regulator
MQQKNRILIIDDEEVITFGFSVVLKEPNVEIDCAHSLEEAGRLITAFQYRAAIVDLRLSDSIEMEGFDCIRLLRTNQSACKVIVLTAYGDNGVRERATLLGIDRFFEKPVEPDLLKKTLTAFNVYDA